MKITAKREAFTTLKDHEPNFSNNPTFRLINPAKTEIGEISKQIIDKINREIVAALELKQWKNTTTVLEWFNNIQEKDKYTFIAIHIVDVYPSITIELLNNALNFASGYCRVSEEMREIITHAKKSCLYKDKEPWGKGSCSDMFDVTMGSFDGAETYELVGTFLLNEIMQKHGNDFGLYRNDGLGITTASPREVEITKKNLCLIFKKYGLKITTDANKKIVNFLDVTPSLVNIKYAPYNKPNNTALYVNAKSNHPPGIIRNISEAINKRLSQLSCDEEASNSVAPIYQTALERNGYKHQLKYSEAQPGDRVYRRARRQNIIWYNSPYSRNVATNIGQIFREKLDKEFPTDHMLHRIFNRNTVKIRYCCMGNVKRNIDSHSKSILSAVPKDLKGCNCQRLDDCPSSGCCLVPAVIHQATVKTSDVKEDQTYVGQTENSFKTRYTNHKASFANAALKKSTELSKNIWSLRKKQR